MTTTHDTSRTIEIEGSPAKLILLSVLGLVMTGASLFVVLYPPLRTDIMAQIVGYFGTLFFGLCTLIGFVRLVRAGRPVVTISPRGIQDVRVASDTIPWAADQEHLDLERARATALDGARGRPGGVIRTLTLTTICALDPPRQRHARRGWAVRHGGGAADQLPRAAVDHHGPMRKHHGGIV
jgi:hypothetical protein